MALHIRTDAAHPIRREDLDWVCKYQRSTLIVVHGNQSSQPSSERYSWDHKNHSLEPLDGTQFLGFLQKALGL